jgi:hypothetical protein
MLHHIALLFLAFSLLLLILLFFKQALIFFFISLAVVNTVLISIKLSNEFNIPLLLCLLSQLPTVSLSTSFLLSA